MNDNQRVSFQSKGRYSILGKLNKNTNSILFVFHGQGQLAKFFIRKFEALQKHEITVIAPEGLHYYYLEGFKGRVGASWMTSENRTEAIENYLNYLNALYRKVEELVSSRVKYSVLGFSQGSATASRWAEQNTFSLDQFILWGGALPPDLNKKLISNRLQNNQLLQVFGNNDPYINSENIEEIKKLTSKYGISSEYKLYEGGHDIDPKVLLEVINHD